MNFEARAAARVNATVPGKAPEGMAVPLVVNQGDDTESLGNGSTAMPGWTVTAPSGHSIAWIGPTNPFGLTASDGGYLLDLTGYDSGGGGGVEQSFTTVKNGQYTVTFDLGGGNGVGIDGAINGAHQTFSREDRCPRLHPGIRKS